AARDTAGLIEESIARSHEGSSKVERVATAIETIGLNMSKMKGIVEEVRESSRQQASGIDQVSVSVGQIQKVTQMTAATAEETAAASDELSSQAEASRLVVRGLRDLVGTGGRLLGSNGDRQRRRRFRAEFPLVETGADTRF